VSEAVRARGRRPVSGDGGPQAGDHAHLHQHEESFWKPFEEAANPVAGADAETTSRVSRHVDEVEGNLRPVVP
jgi:hypothetical protein